jgi:hypothetical protein
VEAAVTRPAVPGDYLVEKRGERWRVLLVRDIVSLSRLEPMTKGEDVVEWIEEIVDSRSPAYAGHVYALAVPIDSEFGSRDEAMRAAGEGSLGTAPDVDPLLVRLDVADGAGREVVRRTPA